MFAELTEDTKNICSQTETGDIKTKGTHKHELFTALSFTNGNQ